MQKAVPVGEGAMAAILGLSMDDVKAVTEEAAEGEVCQVANDNATGQVVISVPRVPLSGPLLWPRKKAPSARCCCLSALLSIVR